MFITNAGNVQSLRGQFNTVILNLPFVSIEADWSNWVFVGAISVGLPKGAPASLHILQTNTFYTRTVSCIKDR